MKKIFLMTNKDQEEKGVIILYCSNRDINFIFKHIKAIKTSLIWYKITSILVTNQFIMASKTLSVWVLLI